MRVLEMWEFEEPGEQRSQAMLRKARFQTSIGDKPALAENKQLGKWCVCLHFMHLNKTTIKFPMPGVDKLLDRLRGSAVY